MKHDYLEQFVSLMPAPGWRAFGCIEQDGGVEFVEIPVVGWAIVRSGRDDEDIVELLLCDGGSHAYTRRWLLDEYPAIEILPPGKELDDAQKGEMMDEMARKKHFAAQVPA